ncbi:MAG: DNA mismatch repair protein MutS, partial [Bacteroidetes bacterium]|nr:DNA mismatch repair protein MutS [Bacteroidota bacterium]
MNPICDPQTLNDLEFSKVRERLASYCLGPTAQQQMKGLVPYSNRRQAIQALEETAELLSIREEGVTFPRLEFEELGKDLKRLRMQNASLFLDGVIRIYQASLLVNELFRFFKTYDEDVPRLRSLMDISWQSMKLIDPVEKVLDKHFKVKDDASPSLLRIRQEMQSKRRQVNRNFDRLLKKMAGQGYLGESNESFLNGRRVLSAISSFKRSVPGRTHGGSRGGAVTYVEPQENIQLNMELDALAYDEEKEIERILAALSEEIRKEVALVESYQELLTTMDAIHARVRLAHLMSATLPYLDDEPGLDLVNAYHPLLLLNN